MGPEVYDMLTSIDRTIHEPARFAILSHLYLVDSAEFLFIRNSTGLTKGNLSSHMSKLEEAGYIKVKKKFIGKKPLTMLMITGKGRKAFSEYRRNMKVFLDL